MVNVMKINKIGILASADASKPAIILERLIRYRLLKNYKLILFTVGATGKCCLLCEKNRIPIAHLSDATLKDTDDVELIKREECDLLVSMGWPHLIPELVLKEFKAAINCHGSILPDYRGSHSYMHYYANCEPNYGSSIHYMNKNFDDGKVLIQAGYETLEGESNDDMQVRTAELCAFLLPTAILLIEKDDAGYEPEGKKRYFFKRTPEEFVAYRMQNEILEKDGKPLILTPHKDL